MISRACCAVQIEALSASAQLVLNVARAPNDAAAYDACVADATVHQLVPITERLWDQVRV